MSYYVYIHEFPNGKRYVGQTTLSLNDRFGTNGGKYSGIMKEAIEEFGWENIKHYYWEVPKEEMLDPLEKFFIGYYDTTNTQKGYNVLSGGKSGWKTPKVVRDKMSESHKGIIFTDSHRENLSKSCSGERNHEYGKPSKRRRRVIVKGVEYDSIKSAAEALGCYSSNICGMLKRGTAQYA